MATPSPGLRKPCLKGTTWPCPNPETVSCREQVFPEALGSQSLVRQPLSLPSCPGAP